MSVCQCWPIREVRIGKQKEGRPLATVNRAMPLLLPDLPFSKIKKNTVDPISRWPEAISPQATAKRGRTAHIRTKTPAS